MEEKRRTLRVTEMQQQRARQSLKEDGRIMRGRESGLKKTERERGGGVIGTKNMGTNGYKKMR